MAGGCEHPGWRMVSQDGAACNWECTTPGCHATKTTYDGKGASVTTESMFDLLEDPDGAPYPEEVQALALLIEEQLDDGLRDQIVVACESVRHAIEERTTVLPHHVVLKNGRLDIVCACGKHFSKDPGTNDLVPDAITLWVKHYNEEKASV